MPKYSLNPNQFPGTKIPHPRPCDVVDAGGKIIDRDDIVYFDTDLGIVISALHDDMGYLILAGVNKDVRLVVEQYPAPLSIRKFVKRQIYLPGR